MATQADKSEMCPILSVLVIGYQMAIQLENTLYTLSVNYQQEVNANDYEVIVVENESDNNMPDEVVAKLPPNFHFHRRPNTSVSPVPAIEFGLTQCRGKYLGVIIDGAQMLTPKVLKYVLMACRVSEQPLIAVPGYHLGTSQQHEVTNSSELMRQQTEFLSNNDWQGDGYLLFQWACFSPGNRHGYLHPLMECNAFFCSTRAFLDIGGADYRFQYPGGGAINLHVYRKLGLMKKTRLFLLPGEGTFHQCHGGVTTDKRVDITEKLAKFREQLQEIWGQNFHALRREPMLLGTMNEQSYPFLITSCRKAKNRHRHLSGVGRALWEDDTVEQLNK